MIGRTRAFEFRWCVGLRRHDRRMADDLPVSQVLQTRISRDVTVLFIDIKGFTAGCAQMTVAQVTARRNATRTDTFFAVCSRMPLSECP